MQQQIPQQEQYGNHHQLPQPIMVCPIQYVYETSTIMPQPQEDQMQPNQILLNVQNPPPWIQNRQQNQVIYVQQVPNNYQAYIHPHMIQNPIYQPQINYQLQQPLITTDNRQYMQIPNLAPYNTVQNQQTLPVQPQVNNDESDKMPLLTQMLNQKPNVVNNVRPTNVTNAQTNTLPRTVTQNQQVQTNITANNKGRPRNVTPQIITINPMQQRQFVDANQKNDVLLNISRPNAPFIRPEVPPHIRNKIPSSISVKSVTRPMQLRPLIRPFGVMNSPQNFVYNPNFVCQPSPETRNMMTNTENSFLKQNNNQQNPNSLNNNTPAIGNMLVANQNNFTSKAMDAMNVAKSKIDLVKIYGDNTDYSRPVTNAVRNTECQTQTEEKLIRNTVYVQARGRVLTEKEIPQNRSPKRAIEETNVNDECHSNNKYIRVEVTDNTSQTNNVMVNSVPAKIPTSSASQETRINNLEINSENLKCRDPNTSIDKTTNVPLMLNEKQAEIHDKKNVKTELEKNNDINNKVSSFKEEIKLEVKEPNDVPKSEDNSPVFKKESKLKDLKQSNDNKGTKIEVLTHVLDGYIIQESNVAFPIYKPTTEREIKQESKDQDKTNIAKANDEVDNETKSHLQWQCLNKSIESDKEMEFATINKDNPFANVQRSSVESWTVDDLAAHLIKNEWKETAAKLQDEEIDGQSVLLVNKDQLVAIGVCESHAEVIAAFNGS